MSAEALRCRREKKLDRRARVWSALEPVAYLLPFIVSILVFTVYPFFNVVFMSFREGFDLLNNTHSGIGPGNYAFVLGNRDFINALTNTGIYVSVVVPVSAALAIVLANLLNRKVRGMAVFQTAYFLPMVTSAMAVGLAWRYIFLRDFGVLNQVLGWFGVDKINWLQRYPWSLYALILFGIWSNLPFTIILMLSGLQNIDETYYTAARVDGARSMRIFFRITVPLLAPTIGLVLTINTISASKVFSELFALFNGPGIGGSLFTVVYYIYEQFAKQRHAWAAAAAMILFLLIFIVTMIQQYIQRKWTY